MSEVNDIVEARRKAFEVTAREHYSLHELDHSWSEREQEYHDSDMQIAWEVYNAALDSVCLELPSKISQYNTDSNGYVNPVAAEYDECIEECREAIERAGLKVKP